jgi:hypothetical protein
MYHLEIFIKRLMDGSTTRAAVRVAERMKRILLWLYPSSLVHSTAFFLKTIICEGPGYNLNSFIPPYPRPLPVTVSVTVAIRKESR